MADTVSILKLPLRLTSITDPDVMRIVVGNPDNPAQAPNGSVEWMSVTDFRTSPIFIGTITGDALVIAGFINIGGTVTLQNAFLSIPALPTSASGLASGRVWRNGTALNIVP